MSKQLEVSCSHADDLMSYQCEWQPDLCMTLHIMLEDLGKNPLYLVFDFGSLTVSSPHSDLISVFYRFAS